MSIQSRISTIFHRYLNVPYTLHAHEFQSPKKPRATFIFIHGIGNTLHSWDETVRMMPEDVRVIGVDLLGFGKSPRPDWAVYSAKTQARSLGVTILGLRLTQKPIIVGHSLGGLVAVAVAKRYPLLARRLVLCSPPFYKPHSERRALPSADDLLRYLYKTAKKHPERLQKLSPLAVKVGLANKELSITDDDVTSYMGALEASIINQTSLEDVKMLKLPIDIFYGTFDPVVIKKHIVSLPKVRPNVQTKILVAGHEVVGGYARSLAKHLEKILKTN